MSHLIPSDLIPRVRRQLRRRGLRTTISKAAQYVRSAVYLQETHVWYELPLGTDNRPRVTLPPELTLVRGGIDDAALLEELPTVIEAEARRRIETGADLWLVLDGRRPAFACWIFNTSMPMLAAPGGQLVLPLDTVCLEDSVTSASYRGRGIAPATWSQLADKLEQTNVNYIITKIEESNQASRRAIVKCGFHESATMHFRRIGLGLRQHTTVQAGAGATSGWLAEQLQH